MKQTDPKLLNDCLEIVAKGGQFRCRKTGREITAVTESDLVEALRERGWKNLSNWNAPHHWMRDSGFETAYAFGNLNADCKSAGDWVRVYPDGSFGRTVSKSTTLFTL